MDLLRLWEVFNQFIIFLHYFRRWIVPAKCEKNFEGGVSTAIKELKTEGLMPIKMTRLAKWEGLSQFPTADVHIKRFGTGIQKAIRVGEIAKLTKGFDGCGSIWNNKVDIAEWLKCPNDFLPAGEIEFIGDIPFEWANNLHSGMLNLCASIKVICERCLLKASRMICIRSIVIISGLSTISIWNIFYFPLRIKFYVLFHHCHKTFDSNWVDSTTVFAVCFLGEKIFFFLNPSAR